MYADFMGVDLGDIAVRRTISLDSLSGKIIAVDAFNTIYQFLASIRQEDGTPLMDFKGRITAHLSGLFYRNARLIENGIKPIYIFDGKSPHFKKATQEERAKNKLEAERKWKEALEAERYDEAKKFAQATSRLTEEMVQESKELLSALGIPSIQAPSEGEAQAAAMVRNKEAYAVGSQDYDSLLFGSPLLIRNINITGKRKVPRQDRFILVEPEEIDLEQTLKMSNLTREKLIMIGLLVGTDFNEGVPRVGPKTAFKIIKDISTLKDLAGYVKEKYNYEFETDIEEVFNFFISPPVSKEKQKPQWGRLNRDKVFDLLVKEHDFSENRIENTLQNIERAYKEKGGQSKLENWLG